MFDNNGYRKQVLVLGLIVIVAGLIAASDALYEKSEEIIALCEAVISAFPTLGMALFVLLAMVSAMLAFFSSAILVPVGVYAWGSTMSFALLWLGWLLGGVASFWVGRYLGRPAAALMVGEARIAGFEEKLGRNAKFIHIVLFQAALPSEIPGYVLGCLRYRFTPFVAALAIAELPYALGTVYLGSTFLNRESAVLLLLGIVGVLVIGLAYYQYRKTRNPMPFS